MFVHLLPWRGPAGAAKPGREKGRGKKNTDDSRDAEPGPMLALGSTGWVLTHEDDKGPQEN